MSVPPGTRLSLLRRTNETKGDKPRGLAHSPLPKSGRPAGGRSTLRRNRTDAISLQRGPAVRRGFRTPRRARRRGAPYSPTRLNDRSRVMGKRLTWGSALLAQLVEHLHGKEGVDGSSPSEGSTKAPQTGALSFELTCTRSSMRWVWSCLWSFQVQNSPSRP